MMSFVVIFDKLVSNSTARIKEMLFYPTNKFLIYPQLFYQLAENQQEKFSIKFKKTRKKEKKIEKSTTKILIKK